MNNELKIQPDYSYYKERLTSYNEQQWPSNAPIYIKELVEAGFVYTGKDDLVFCFRCGVTAQDWKDDDNPLVCHQRLNEHCLFLQERAAKVSSSDPQNEEIKRYPTSLGVYGGETQRNEITQCTSSDRSLTYGAEFAVQIHNVQNEQRALNIPLPASNGLDNGLYPAKSQAFDFTKLHSITMRSEEERFKSFAICPIKKHWPSPEKLSAAGFYCIDSVEGKVQCFCCGIEIDGWESSQQDAMQRHRSVSLSCKFAQGLVCGNIIRDGEEIVVQNLQPAFKQLVISPEQSIEPPELKNLVLPSERYLDDRSIGRVKSDPLKGMNSIGNTSIHPPLSGSNSGNYPYLPLRPMHTPYQRTFSIPSPVSNLLHSHQQYALPSFDMSDRSKRLQTFLTWPKNAPVQPVELVDAGFFYVGTGDRVRCYKCDISLTSWEAGDKAWSEHIRYSPSCHLVIQHIREINNVALRNTTVSTKPYTQVRSSLHQSHEPYFMQYSPHNPHVRPQTSNYQQPEDYLVHANQYHFLQTQLRQTASHHPYDPMNYHHNLNQHSKHNQSHIRTNSQEHYIQNNFKQHNDTSYLNTPNTRTYGTPLTKDITTTYFPRHHSNDSPPVSSKDYVDPSSHNCGNLNPNIHHNNLPRNQNILNSSHKLFNGDNGLDRILDMGFSEESVKRTTECYEEYSRPFTSLDHLAQAIIYFEKYGNLEGSPFGRNLQQSTPDGQDMVSPKHEENKATDQSKSNNSDGKTCKICMDNDVEITFVPCGHLIVCQSCALDMKQCPLCRIEIKSTVRTYLPY